MPEKIVKGGEKLPEAKATTLRRVLLARSCHGGEDVVGRGESSIFLMVL